MKYFLFFLFFSLSSSVTWAQNQQLAACCSTTNGGRCTGSEYCTACKNCSGCKHCNSGGSCGVCRPKTKARKAQKVTKRKTHYNIPDQTKAPNYLKGIRIQEKSVLLRKGPGLDFATVLKLYKNDQLLYLASTGSWIKVKVVGTSTVGFIQRKEVLVGE